MEQIKKLKEIGRKASKEAYKEAKDLKLPVTYIENDKVIKEYINGNKEILGFINGKNTN